MQKSRVKYLLQQYAATGLTPPEMEELTEAVQTENDVPAVLEELLAEAKEDESLATRDWQPLLSKITGADKIILTPAEETDKVETIAPVHRVHFLRRGFLKYAAAILILIGVGSYFFFNNNSINNKPATVTPAKVADVLPGSDKAILTLSNGEKIELNSATSETFSDGNQSIKNNNGQLVYNSARGSLSPAGGSTRDAGEGGPAMNTMSTPNSAQYKLTLSDGTRVWLNAASSITYPISFTEKNRTVSITGEAYFEVAQNKSKPFIVETLSPAGGSTREAGEGGQRITVLGTSFNINSYKDEPHIKTSLSEGSIKVNNNILKPGQAFTNGKITRTNLDQDIAWKNGIFNFDRIKLKDAMRQLARWYDIKVEFTGNLDNIELRGEIGRDLNLQDVLSGLQDTNLHFQLNGKILRVSK